MASGLCVSQMTAKDDSEAAVEQIKLASGTKEIGSGTKQEVTGVENIGSEAKEKASDAEEKGFETEEMNGIAELKVNQKDVTDERVNQTEEKVCKTTEPIVPAAATPAKHQIFLTEENFDADEVAISETNVSSDVNVAKTSEFNVLTKASSDDMIISKDVVKNCSLEADSKTEHFNLKDTTQEKCAESSSEFVQTEIESRRSGDAPYEGAVSKTVSVSHHGPSSLITTPGKEHLATRPSSSSDEVTPLEAPGISPIADAGTSKVIHRQPPLALDIR